LNQQGGKFMPTNISDNSQGDTGTRDITYDLISTAYHLLQGAETLALYIADAEQEGNQEILQFLRETKEEYIRRADRAKQLLISYSSQEQAQSATGA
jgi:hypothetical protein